MPRWCFGSVLLRAKEGNSTARKVGQLIALGDRRWLIRVYVGRDHETDEGNSTIESFRVPCGNRKPTSPENCANATWDAIWKEQRCAVREWKSDPAYSAWS